MKVRVGHCNAAKSHLKHEELARPSLPSDCMPVCPSVEREHEEYLSHGVEAKIKWDDTCEAFSTVSSAHKYSVHLWCVSGTHQRTGVIVVGRSVLGVLGKVLPYCLQLWGNSWLAPPWEAWQQTENVQGLFY